MTPLCLNFVCAPRGSGPRLGGDRDEDGFLNGDDCASADASVWDRTGPAENLSVDQSPATELNWQAASPIGGTTLQHEIIGGSLAALHSLGLAAATGCVEPALPGTTFTDPRPDPAPGAGYFYLVRGANACGGGDAGPGRAALDALVCSSP